MTGASPGIAAVKRIQSANQYGFFDYTAGVIDEVNK
jgi:hypothetical protein